MLRAFCSISTVDLMAKETISRHTPFEYAASAFCTLFPMNGYLYNLIAFVLLVLSDTQRYRDLALQSFQAEQQCTHSRHYVKKGSRFSRPKMIIPGPGGVW
jgi:hypothetical protein